MLQDPHHVYLGLDVINNDYTTNGTRPYLRFEEIRNTPFLDGDSAEYFCSIVRFTIQTGNTIPVFIQHRTQSARSKSDHIHGNFKIPRGSSDP